MKTYILIPINGTCLLKAEVGNYPIIINSDNVTIEHFYKAVKAITKIRANPLINEPAGYSIRLSSGEHIEVIPNVSCILWKKG